MKLSLTDFTGKEIQILIEDYLIDDFDIAIESKNWNKILEDGEVRLCYFPMFPIKHQRRPSIIVNSNGIGPLIMVTAHIETGKNDWKKYPENIFIEDWKDEGFKRPSYANTGLLLDPKDIKILNRIGSLMSNDYNRIVKPTIDRLNAEKLDALFESFDYDTLINTIDLE